MREVRLAAVVPARNEEQCIGETLSALRAQYNAPNKIIVVNDGSTDSTAEIARSAGAHVIDLQDRGHNALGTPFLAGVINKGLDCLLAEGYGKSPSDYVMIVGADHILPPNYTSTLLDLMETNRTIAVCSGQIRGERSVIPRGSGRLVRADVWRKFGLQYPENYGFETYLLVKVQQEGYEVLVLNELLTDSLRKTGKHYKKSVFVSYGKSLKALGYSKLYSVARIGLMSIKHPKGGLYMMQGYMSRNIQSYDPELRAYLSSIQHKRIKRYVTNPIRALTGEAA
ncbi:MAG TPA: glycosyltransferase family A protein [Nitrososphaera sp.]|nr:glycosyltransferase family A protein [Nitrososphaera sp.]